AGTFQQFAEGIHAGSQGNRQADGGPQGIASSHPIPQRKDIVGVNAECHRLGNIGGDCDKVPVYAALFPAVIQVPATSQGCVLVGFQSAKGLGGDDEQGG